MNKTVWIVVVVVVISGVAYPKLKPLWSMADSSKVTAASTASSGTAKATNGKAESAAKKTDAAPLQVETFTVKPAPYAETIASTGSLRAEEGVELQAETNGKVVSINFTEGTAVKKGALLVKLNDSDLRANLARFGYSKKLAVARERRFAQLLKQGVVTQDEYDTALTDVNVQQANIDLYAAQIEKTEVRAPFDGVVGLRYVSVGAFVNAATKIATLQRLDNMKVDFSIPEKYSGRVKVGAPIAFTVAGGLKTFSGTIFAIDPRIDSGTRTLLLRATCPNVEGSLAPGAFANVTVQLEQLPDALLVPAEAVVAGLDEKNVFVMKNGVAERRAVEIGSRSATQVHVLAGLQPGDVLITSGLQQMRVGQAVARLANKVDIQGDEESHTKQPAQAEPPAKSETSATQAKPAQLAGV